MISKTRIFRKLSGLYGSNVSVADFFDCSPSSIERCKNAGGRISVEDQIFPLENETTCFPYTIERFRGVLQALNNKGDARISEQVDIIHAALMQIKALDSKQFDTPE